MKASFLIVLYLLGINSIINGQDKDAEAKVHYTKAEDAYNKGTFLGASECIYELTLAEEALGTTNPKILYLKIMASEKIKTGGYYYNQIIWLKNFFRITDVKTFPSNKYADIINIDEGFTKILVEDKLFEIKAKDSLFLKKNYEYSPDYIYSSEAAYNFAQLLYIDNDVQGKSASLFYFNESANNGNTLAMDKLGFMYQNGSGVERDNLKALKWYLKAERNGDTIATKRILNIYYSAVLMPALSDVYKNSNGQEIVTWCKTLAEKGNNEAMLTIAKIYDEGLGGVKQDNYQALSWYIKSYNPNDHTDIFIDIIHNRSNSEEKDKTTRKAINEMYNKWFTENRNKHN